jgi:hypothetical protein
MVAVPQITPATRQKRHRSELREPAGWHECTKTDLVKLVSHLAESDIQCRIT